MTEWHPITSAPFGHDLQLAVIERDEVHSLVFPCRRTRGGWVHASTGSAISVDPSHWREWPADDPPISFGHLNSRSRKTALRAWLPPRQAIVQSCAASISPSRS